MLGNETLRDGLEMEEEGHGRTDGNERDDKM